MAALNHADARIRALLGQTLAERYRIDEIIGVGGMGVVYRALQLKLKRDVAVKVLRSDGGDREEAAQRFMREAESAARLDHENCVRVYDFGVTDDDIYYMVMPVLEGAPLKDIFEGLRTSPRRTLEIAAQLFDGLEHAHQRQVVHRDLKPDNLFLSRNDAGRDHVTIVDFGIAKILEAADDGLTQAGQLYGTPAFMSPEQAAGDPLDARSDLFSAGIIAFRLITGRVPGRAASALEQLRKRASQEIPPLPHTVPEGVRELVARLCALDPEERFQSAGEAAAFTRQILAQWDAANERHDRLVELPDEDATEQDISPDYSTMRTELNERALPKGPTWLPWLAGGVAVASFALAAYSLRGQLSSGGEHEETTVVAGADDAPLTPEESPALGAEGEADAGEPPTVTDGGSELEAPPGTEPTTLDKLAQVNQVDPAQALPYDARHALIAELEGDRQAAPMINKRVNLAMDLLQAEQAEDPCEVFVASLMAIDATRDRFYEPTLRIATPPTTEGEGCEGLDDQLARVRVRFGLAEPTPTAAKVGKKVTKTSKKVGKTKADTGGDDEGVQAGQVIEKLDEG